MTDDEFATLVERLEARARSEPEAYGRQVLGVAMLGNLYLATIVLLTTSMLVAAVASVAYLHAFGVKLALVIGIFLWTVVRALWVSLPAPSGREITRAQAPALFAMLDDLRAALDAPSFHHVLLSDDFNAGVVQVPRLGIFGWPRNYLLLGLPLMKSLREDQFKAVLAHEYGHLAGGHSRLSNWIYRQRERWGKLLDALSDYQGSARFLFLPFLRWYTPYFNAFSFPLARANEYAADAAAARLTSAEALGSALAGSSVIGAYLAERYWPGIHAYAQDTAQPHFTPYANLTAHLGDALPLTSAADWLSNALACQTTLHDTHPALSDRLAALGVDARLAPATIEDSADKLLGAQCATITAEFDAQWRDAIAPAWAAHHAAVTEQRAVLAALQARHAAGEQLDEKDAFNHAFLTAHVGHDAPAALALWQALFERAPQHALVRLRYGEALITTDSAAGMALIEQAMADDANLSVEACTALRDGAWVAGDKDAALRWHERLQEREALEAAAAAERNAITYYDELEPHALDADTVERMRATLRAIAGLKTAYLVRKRCDYLPDNALFVLGYTVDGWFAHRRYKRARQVLASIQAELQFAGETIILHIEDDNRQLAGPIIRVDNARLI